MSIEYLLVICPDNCPVRADGNGVGFTNHTLILPADEYTITVDTQGCTPASVDVVLSGSSLVKPCVVVFSRPGAAAGPPAAITAQPVPVGPTAPAAAAAKKAVTAVPAAPKPASAPVPAAATAAAKGAASASRKT